MTKSNVEKVASSNGYGYSIKFRKENVWKTFKDRKPFEYSGAVLPAAAETAANVVGMATLGPLKIGRAHV